MRCPACGESELDVFFDAGSLPVFVNVLHDSAEEARLAARGELRLGACHHCDLIHNVAFDPALVEYAPGYENSLHGSPTFQTWARELAGQLVREHDATGKRVIEVGGGRGEFMQLLLEAGAGRGLVMDPSAPPDALSNTTAGDLAIERRLFTASDVDAQTALVLSRHVLEHLSDPLAFARLLGDSARGVGAGLYIEVPNGLWTLRDLGVWDLIYEHCSYFTPSALAGLLVRSGAQDVRTSEGFYGQFLAASAGGSPSPALRSGAQSIDLSLDQRALEQAFREAYAQIVARWSSRLERARDKGQRLALWGAGSKGATFLNTLDTAETVICAVDLNPLKQGRYIAGSGHEIIAPAALGGLDIDGLLVMNPAYAAEIEQMARSAGCQAEVLIDQAEGSVR